MVTTTVPESSPASSASEDADLALLTGADATGLVAAALGGGAPIGGLQVEVHGVHHRPGAGVSVTYLVRHDGGEPEILVASTTAPHRDDLTDHVAILEDGERVVRVWRRSHDPALPGLRYALDPAVVAGWVGRSDRPQIELLGYRPTRRAVAVARFGDLSIFVKVVRPRRAAELIRRHELLQGTAVPAPQVLAEPVAGAVVLASAPGWSLAQALSSQQPEQLPTPGAVVAALDSLPAAVGELTLRPSWVDRLDFHAAAARSALPERAGEIDAVAGRVAAVLADLPEAPLVATHGDLNVANLFVRDGAPSALIDVDSLGPGRRADDLATLLAHLLVLPPLAPTIYPQVDELAAAWRAELATHVGAAELDARTAAVLISLVAGAAADQAHARLDLALASIERAERRTP